MSDYGADANPDLPAAKKLAYDDNMVMSRKLQLDQFTIDSDRRVVKFCDGRHEINIRFLVDTS